MILDRSVLDMVGGKVLFEQRDLLSSVQIAAGLEKGEFGVNNFLLTHGRLHFPRRGHPKMKPLAWRRNAGKKRIEHNLLYVEGYVATKGEPLLWAWNIDSKGPVDFTPGQDPNYEHLDINISNDAEHLGLIIPNEVFLDLDPSVDNWGVLAYLAVLAPQQTRDRLVQLIAEANPVADVDWDAVCEAL